MRTRRSNTPLPHVLVVGDHSELASIRSLLHLLPGNAYGHVFVEVAAGQEVPAMSRPARVAVTVVQRAPSEERGDRLGAATQAWCREWMPSTPDAARQLSFFAGSTVRIDDVNLALELERL